MASSDEKPGPMPGPEGSTPGKAMTTGQRILDKGAQIVQSLKPIKHISQHACTFAFYAHDLSRHIQTHHFLSRLNQDFLQCPVYDSDSSDARLIGIEYIISEWVFEALPAEEQKLWHSHAYEIKSGLWINPGMAETIQKLELRNLAKTYGKFWCTWQVDRGDKLPLGAPALMVSPQAEIMGLVNPQLINKRDEKYRITSEDVIESRAGIEEPETISLHADHWRNTGKGFAIDVVQTEVLETSAHCCSHFGYNNSTPYMPHMSLIYGDITDEEKKKAQEKATILDDGISNLSFPITRLALYKTDVDDKTTKSWEKVAECDLISA